jgi:hypothetical protein
MIIVGIDPHKTSHTAVAVDQREQPVGQLTRACGMVDRFSFSGRRFCGSPK